MHVLRHSLIAAAVASVGLYGCAPPPPPPPVVAAAPQHLSTPPTPAPACGKPAEQAAFGVAGLKSQLMVTTLSCNADEKYNAFIKRYRKDLLANETVLNSYFSRAYGRAAVSQHDEYISNLANQSSQVSLRAGAQYCAQNLSLFDEVLALKDGNDMVKYAMGKKFEQPLAVPDCATADATPPAKATPAKKVATQ